MYKSIQIQEQIHHSTEAFLPSVDGEYTFFQVYFPGNSENEVYQRCAFNRTVRREIVIRVQQLLHIHMNIIR